MFVYFRHGNFPIRRLVIPSLYIDAFYKADYFIEYRFIL